MPAGVVSLVDDDACVRSLSDQGFDSCDSCETGCDIGCENACDLGCENACDLGCDYGGPAPE